MIKTLYLLPNGGCWSPDGLPDKFPAWMDLVASFLTHTQTLPAEGVTIQMPNGWEYKLRRNGAGHSWERVYGPEVVEIIEVESEMKE